jgi:hypothetical protein
MPRIGRGDLTTQNIKLGVTVRRGNRRQRNQRRRPGGMTRVTKGSLTSVGRGGGSLRFQVNPETVEQSGGVGGWLDVDRPRRWSVLEFGSVPLTTLTFDLWFDGWPDRSIESEIGRLRNMGQPTAKGDPPPLLRLNYGRLGNQNVWVVESMDFGDELRNRNLQRVRVRCTITLKQYRAAEVTFGHARRFNQRRGRRGGNASPRTRRRVGSGGALGGGGGG